MAVVAEQLSNLENKKRHNLFVPARGGIGEAITVQANSVSARMAAKQTVTTVHLCSGTIKSGNLQFFTQ